MVKAQKKTNYLAREKEELARIKKRVKSGRITEKKGYLDGRVITAGLLATTPDLGPCISSRQKRGLRNTNKRVDCGNMSVEMGHRITNIIMGV